VSLDVYAVQARVGFSCLQSKGHQARAGARPHVAIDQPFGSLSRREQLRDLRGRERGVVALRLVRHGGRVVRRRDFRQCQQRVLQWATRSVDATTTPIGIG
jgi:hypothetical protein